MKKIEEKIAERVREYGGRTFYVGGFVRDRILGIENKDVDIEVHGISPEELAGILEEVGKPLSIGSSFGIYKLAGYDIDIAIPRSEYSTGKGHRDFEMRLDPFIGVTEAARRRDFTMNAVMEDVLSGERFDPFGGQADIAAGIIRHVDEHSFVEDPLRVLRAAQFSSRFGFEIAEETVRLCRSIDISALSRERVEEELKKALLKAEKPSIFFEALRKMDQLGFWFPEAEALIGLEQDPIYHPEGDVWVHSMEVLDRAASYRESVSNSYAFMLLALTHDFGKVSTQEFKGGRIHNYGHETEGLPAVESFLRRITGEKEVISYVLNMVALHMKPNRIAYHRSAAKTCNRMFDEAASPRDLVYFAMSDKPVFAGNEPFSGDSAFLFERLEAFEETMAKPYVSGKDLVDAGFEPGPVFSELLAYAHKLRLAGIEKETALKQVLGQARKLR